MIYPLNISAEFLHHKNILITGGTGSFGNQMVKTLSGTSIPASYNTISGLKTLIQDVNVLWIIL